MSSNKDINALDYMGSVRGLPPQQKSKAAPSEAGFEDASIMLDSKQIARGNESPAGSFNNSVWQNKENKNSDPQDSLSEFSSSQAEAKALSKGQMEPQDPEKPNFFANAPVKDSKKTVEKRYDENGVLTEVFEQELFESGNLAKIRIKKYNELGKVFENTISEYSEKERFLTKLTTETYDKNEALLFKKSVNNKYDSQGRVTEETGEIYNQDDKPVKIYVTKNLKFNKKGESLNSVTDKYEADGSIIASEKNVNELSPERHIERKTVYTKGGEVSSQEVENIYYNTQGLREKNHWQLYKDGELLYEEVAAYHADGQQSDKTKHEYDGKSLVSKTVDINDDNQTTEVEHFDKGKLDYKTITKNVYNFKGNPIKEKSENFDADGKFLSKKNISREFKTFQNDDYEEQTETGIVVEKYNEKNKLTKKVVNAIQKDAGALRIAETGKTYDGAGNLTAKAVSKYKIMGEVNFITSQVKTNYKGAKVVSTETLNPSAVPGEFIYKTSGEKASASNFIDVNKSQAGVNIAKKLESPDGTKTDYQYSEDNDGNKKLSYIITDKDGKELMSTAREYKKISENSAVSKIDSREYRIETKNDVINVFDVTNKTSTQIDLNKFVQGKNEEQKKLIKRQPGDVLIGLSKEVNRIGADEEENGNYFHNEEWITVGNRDASIAHEYGHSIDAKPDGWNVNYYGLSQGKEFKEVFNKELENFRNSSTEADEDAFSYFNENPSEFIAETNMLTTTRGDKERNAARDFLMMKNFPKSIATAFKLLKAEEASDSRKKIF